MSVVARFMQSFRNFTTDAVPQAPRVTIEDVTEEEQPSVAEPTTTPEVASQTQPKKSTKKPFGKSKKEKTKSRKPNAGAEPFQPIRTQATGNVINVIHSPGSHVGTNITYNIGSYKKEENIESSELSIRKTKSIKELLASTDKVEGKYMTYISRNIGSGWKAIFRSFGLSDGFIEITYEDNINQGLSEVIYKLILDWVRNGGSLGQLSTLLWKNGKRSVVKEMAALYKNDEIDKWEE